MPKPPTDWTVLSMLEWATSYFEEKGIDNGRFSIEWLLAELLQVKRLDLYLLFDRPLTQEELEELRAEKHSSWRYAEHLHRRARAWRRRRPRAARAPPPPACPASPTPLGANPQRLGRQ